MVHRLKELFLLSQQMQFRRPSWWRSSNSAPKRWVVLAYIIVVSCGTAALARACAVEECH